jgi:hypothetical protein
VVSMAARHPWLSTKPERERNRFGSVERPVRVLARSLP